MNRMEVSAVLSEEGHTFSSIAEELGVRRDTLARWIRRETIPVWSVGRLSSLLELSDEEMASLYLK